ncbi:hypothetical protein Bca4012_061341 [Brassica carinata]|uniref:Uncharacterized protein n=1 Tax=Brassica carinata TaxID=52824 RepID=A0A8X7V5G5_BRACI|nr:hypothetical protein Bca52824_031635 [Brassica carinata]
MKDLGYRKSGEGKKTMGITTAPIEHRWLPNRIIRDYTVARCLNQLNDRRRCIFSVTPASEVSRGRQHHFQKKEIRIPTNPSRHSR